MSDSQLQVILNIFSGMPNPTWFIPQEKVSDLTSRLTELNDGQEPVEPPILGYRGFIIKNKGAIQSIPDEITVFSNILTINLGGQISFKTDDSNIEGWLIEMARNLGYGDIIDESQNLVS